ncbi:large-conductance mechanosensitive channel [Polychytrium aggregatum]|uniref:large-conductance mechanosensitive channel n=1 Tax=Polychytrium aggregatum TaxID=110093 RepID=UPI0022FEBECB|nr:large-conductance mechanosensitive channel [Polychytrium aggregatum]KAI9206613.1 large-conductance mechanosensitive channel [Polychytrium aggregatum]
MDKAKQAAQATKAGAVKGVQAVNSVWKDFHAFISRGNVIDLAVGIIIGGAFTAIVTSFVTDIISPVIALATQSQLDQSFIIFRCPPATPGCRDLPISLRYNTTTQAHSAGAVTWNWGNFLMTIINFILTAIILFFLLKVYTAAFIRKKVEDPKTKECPYCTKDIPIKATRCPECTGIIEAVHAAPAGSVTIEFDKSR